MTTYLIGDIHGYYNEFISLLKKIHFNCKKDQLWVTGDLIARGPDSIKVLCYLYSIKDSVKLVLGNHDLYLISLVLNYNINNNLNKINDPQILQLLKNEKIIFIVNYWLKYQPLIQYNKKKKILMSHAGITPQWNNIKEIISFAYEANNIISSKNNKIFLDYINNENYQVNDWKKNTLMGFERFNFIVNSLTKMRYCYPNGTLEMFTKKAPNDILSKILKPWFWIPNILYKKYTIFFGHWSDLQGGKYTPKNIIGLDTGCCWGKKLTIYSWEKKQFFSKICKI
ncbi:bis(5'-nucleosyl)-tetraphosphatase (symmetrical) ApaH [Enterobacteriaceae endosymbiont of Donacia semicuprea]|uniref:bis(5'-nucleosyl)-tetraphosphatase (symmetrical) ApaH n=1 Tax=Enterobacteriaceae endosymbiont of Donacia semicuprea TaxID=2675783 RepID=UPI001449CF4F|nr:bis(5'-nucleosyl)-tetraphosphatase (symmetrical) ApaH [Enterobacteriaceae endosymbiont of Donacia semicuprea]QJC32836.1 bis(5'-nucleosyl)-tetraphosphatase (symmetrical) [Enterobacteriaceae endosymbiont of Donacia semicuprea]